MEIGYRVSVFNFISYNLVCVSKKCNKGYNFFFQVAKRGEVLKVKVLGAVALIDEGMCVVNFKIYHNALEVTY